MNKMKKCKLIILLFFLLALTYSCKKDNLVLGVLGVNQQEDRWITGKKIDSAGNTYCFAYTHFNTLELRIHDKGGKELLTKTCVLDSSEIPEHASNVYVSFVIPNRFIGAHDATLSIALFQDEAERSNKYVQLLMNVNTETKKLYIKKYTVDSPDDWGHQASEGALVQWYQNTLLVKEGADADLNITGGILGEGRGTLLVCYERDFSVRYTKNIDANNAYYPVSRRNYIPVSDFEAIYFREDGLIARERMVTSAAEAAEMRPTVWRIDFKQFSKLPADYAVKLKSYNLQDNTVLTSYDIFDEKGAFKASVTKEWDAGTGFLKHN
ncbi:MAG: hypothetical protein K0R59_136 [Sphingobacterium sp.]|nr:hypothetical protein [Sphingobacterium sp.]